MVAGRPTRVPSSRVPSSFWEESNKKYSQDPANIDRTRKAERDHEAFEQRPEEQRSRKP